MTKSKFTEYEIEMLNKYCADLEIYTDDDLSSCSESNWTDDEVEEPTPKRIKTK